MEQLLRILETYQPWIYLFLGLVSLFQIRKFFLALKQWRGTNFTLEKEVAQQKISKSVSILAILFALGTMVFVLATFVLPVIPGLQLLATPTFALPDAAQMTLEPGTATAQEIIPGSPTIVPEPGTEGGCIKEKLAFTYPLTGDGISGVVELKGVIAVENFGFYKYEYASQGSTTWLTIAAGDILQPDGSLGFWDTSQLVPGDYRLRLVVTDNKGQILPSCEIVVRVSTP